MPAWGRLFQRSYWALAGLGGIWALSAALLTWSTFQRHALYMHRLNTGWWWDAAQPETFGFASTFNPQVPWERDRSDYGKHADELESRRERSTDPRDAEGQVTPFWLDTSDGEKLFCWHVLPLDVYAEHEHEIVQKSSGDVVGGLQDTVGAKLLARDGKAKVVVNFHGNAGDLPQGWRPSTYRSITNIPHTHLLTCDYRGYGKSTLNVPPHIPTEAGLIIDAVSLVSYLLNDLRHPASETVLLGQSLGTAVTAATALYFADPTSPELPLNVTQKAASTAALSMLKDPFAGIILVAPFPSIPELLQSYKFGGIIPFFAPLRSYPRVANYLTSKIIDTWRTSTRLQALIGVTGSSHTSIRISLLHARNDQDIPFRLSEAVYAPLATRMLAEEGVVATEERRSIHGGERVRRGAFAYRNVESGDGERMVELEVTRFGGHNQVVGWNAVALSVRRCFAKKSFRPGLDVE